MAWGLFAPQNDALAVEWWRKAADQGYAQAQSNLGVMYREGRGGLPQSDALAVEWYRKAADQGYAEAQYNLGVMYELGQGGLPQSDALAVEWWRKAAHQGEALAQYNLGAAYANGQGVPQNFPEALRWQSQSTCSRRRAGGCDRSDRSGAADATPTAAGSGRSGVTTTTTTKSPASSSSPPPSPIPIGTRVELHGLQMKKLNRQRGVVVGFDAGSGRCVEAGGRARI